MPLTSAAIGALADLSASNPGVVGYSEDEIEEVSGGAPTGRHGIRVFVEDEDAAGKIPTEIGGVPVVEVRSVGSTDNKRTQPTSAGNVGADPKSKVRPVIGGISISAKESGTLGYFIVIGTDRCLVSAAHVLPTGNDTVIQPSFNDGGKAQDTIAAVVNRVLDPESGVDAAAAVLSVGSTLDLNGLGKVVGISTVNKGDKVKKSGKNSGVTEGEVIDVNFTWAAAPEGPFKHQIVVESKTGFSVGGDSGSLVVTPALEAVGLLKGGGQTVDYVNPIDRVLAALGGTLAT
jgi:hypothetical protein